jgi:histidinol dehydrogenase
MKIFTYPSKAAETRVNAIVNRGLGLRKKDEQAVARILAEVKKEGDKAVVRYSARFDSPRITTGTLRVTDKEFKAARGRIDRGFMRSLNRAVTQIEQFHREQRQRSWISTDRPGTMLGQLVRPVDAAGVYVPGAQGGKTPLVSSVLMGAIPAKIAGVSTIVIATPPRADGTVDPHLLVAAQKVGADAVFKMGSAWAVGAMAYGTDTVPKVDVIVGPGNVWVTLAKKLVSGTVGIDMIAGPSEILILADGSADPAFAAADLLSQAEHDPVASAVLVTTSAQLAEQVGVEVDRQLEALSRKEIARAAIDRFGAILVVPDLGDAFDLANRFAPEHLELLVENPFEHLGLIRNAGAVFIGPHTPEPVGDYVAGPNHVLPTVGTARFSSALSVDNFIKKTSLIHYSEAAFRREAGDIMRLACTEGLDAHANSVRVRMKRERGKRQR